MQNLSSSPPWRWWQHTQSYVPETRKIHRHFFRFVYDSLRCLSVLDSMTVATVSVHLLFLADYQGAHLSAGHYHIARNSARQNTDFENPQLHVILQCTTWLAIVPTQKADEIAKAGSTSSAIAFALIFLRHSASLVTTRANVGLSAGSPHQHHRITSTKSG